jgi:hypothetical protein
MRHSSEEKSTITILSLTILTDAHASRQRARRDTRETRDERGEVGGYGRQGVVRDSARARERERERERRPGGGRH